MFVGIDFIENENHRFVGCVADFMECFVDNLDLFLESRVRDVHDMQEQIGFTHFIEGGFERLDEVGRQFAYKSHRVGEQERQIVDDNFSDSGIESGEKFVFCKNFRFAQ